MDFREVCTELNFPYSGDWGIINSDSTRVVEFIEYVHDRLDLNFPARYNLLGLILASMNDAILEGIADCNVHDKFYKYIKPVLSDERYYPIIPYWIRIKSEEEFPVGYLLEKYKEEDQEGFT